MRIGLTFCLMAATFAGCDKKPADDDNDVSVEEAAEPDGGKSELDSVAEGIGLDLAASMSPNIPDSVAALGSGSSFASKELGMSFEACHMRANALDMKRNLDFIAATICAFESQPSVKLGGKYKFIYSEFAEALEQEIGGGEDDDFASEMPESISVFFDDSVDEQITVYLCADDQLTDKFVITELGESGSRGTFKSKYKWTSYDFQIQGAFDNGVSEVGRFVGWVQSSFALESSGMSSRNHSKVMMDLKNDGISALKVATEVSDSEGNFTDSTKEVSTALISPTLGSALFHRTFNDEYRESLFGEASDSDSDGETSRSFFDNAGNNIAESSSKGFASAGSLFVAVDTLPKLMSDKFKVEFEDSDWDCSGTKAIPFEKNETFHLCYENLSREPFDLGCDSEDFKPGTQVHDLTDIVVERSGELDPTVE